MLAGLQPLVALGKPLLVHRGGVQLGAGGLVRWVVAVEQLAGDAEPRPSLACEQPEPEALVDLLGELAGEPAAAGSRAAARSR